MFGLFCLLYVHFLPPPVSPSPKLIWMQHAQFLVLMGAKLAEVAPFPPQSRTWKRDGTSLPTGTSLAAAPGRPRAGTITDEVCTIPFTGQGGYSAFCYVDSKDSAALQSSEQLIQRTLRSNVALITTQRSWDVTDSCVLGEKQSTTKREKRRGFTDLIPVGVKFSCNLFSWISIIAGTNTISWQVIINLQFVFVRSLTTYFWSNFQCKFLITIGQLLLVYGHKHFLMEYPFA